MPVGKVLARGHQLALVLLALLGSEPPPGGVDLQERVLDEVTCAHELSIIAPGTPPARSELDLPALLPPGTADTVSGVRIALLSPYSWTYPGGVTRHIEALAGELVASGHEPRILAPFDPDDALSARLHRGARPQGRPMPERFVSLGRTVGLPANGAVSNVALSPHAVFTLAPRAAPRRLRRGAHPRAGRPARRLGRAVLRGRSPARRHLPHLLREPPHERDRGHPPRRAAAHEPPARSHRRLRGRLLDGPALLRRPLPHHPQRRAPRRGRCVRGRRRRRGHRTARVRVAAPGICKRRARIRSGRCGSCSSARPSNARACRSCCVRSRRFATTCRRRSRSSARAPRRSPT